MKVTGVHDDCCVRETDGQRPETENREVYRHSGFMLRPVF